MMNNLLIRSIAEEFRESEAYQDMKMDGMAYHLREWLDQNGYNNVPVGPILYVL